MTKTETWAVARPRIEEFFRSLPDVDAAGNGFRWQSCRIRLTEQEDHTLGSLRFPRTCLELEGDPEDVAAIYNRFFLRFISAGG